MSKNLLFCNDEEHEKVIMNALCPQKDKAREFLA